MEELLDVYDAAGRKIGQEPRSRCHGDPALLHHTAHIMVFHPQTGELLLQLRAKDKDIQPDKWDTAVGGHLAVGEDFESGALRELAEELGITDAARPLKLLFFRHIRNEIESEDAAVFRLECAGPFDFDRREIQQLKFWSPEELFSPANRRNFTPNLCAELDEMRRRRWL